MSRRRTARHAAACPACLVRDNTIATQRGELNQLRAAQRRQADRSEQAAQLLLHLVTRVSPAVLTGPAPGWDGEPVVLGDEVLRAAGALMGLHTGARVMVDDWHGAPGCPSLPGRVTGYGFTPSGKPGVHVTMDDPAAAAYLNSAAAQHELPAGVVFVIFPQPGPRPIADGGHIEVQP